VRRTASMLLSIGLSSSGDRSKSAATAPFWHPEATALAVHAETSALMMHRDDQANDHDDRSGRNYQDHREDVLEDPVLACYPLPVIRRHPGSGRMIAGGRIVQVESSAAAAQAISWVPSRATNPNHHASRRPSVGSVTPCRMLKKIAAATLWSSYLAARDDRARRRRPNGFKSICGSQVASAATCALASGNDSPAKTIPCISRISLPGETGRDRPLGAWAGHLTTAGTAPGRVHRCRRSGRPAVPQAAAGGLRPT